MFTAPTFERIAIACAVLIGVGACSEARMPSLGTEHVKAGTAGEAVAGSGASAAGRGGPSAAGQSAAPAGSAGRAATGAGGTVSANAGRAAAAGSRAGTPPECMVELSRSSCPATFEAALTEFRCRPMDGSSSWLTECGSRRIVMRTFIDVATTCVYDASGARVGSRSCSKTIGNCNCFVAGDVPADLCDGKAAVDLCDADAGTN